MKYFFTLLLAVSLSINLNAEIIKVGKGSYINEPPAYVPGTSNFDFPDKSRPKNVSGPVIAEHAPLGMRWQMLKPAVTENFMSSGKKITTNKWWSSILFKFNGNTSAEKMYPGPLCIKPDENGLYLGLQRVIRVYDDFTQVRGLKDTSSVKDYRVSHIVNVWQNETYFGINDMKSDSVLVDDYGDWHVKSAWVKDNSVQMTASIARGLPYVYFEDLSRNFVVKTDSRFSVWYEDDDMLAFRAEGADRENFVIFKPEGAEFIFEDKQPDVFNKFFFKSLEVNLNGKDYISVAAIFDENAPLPANTNPVKAIDEYENYSNAVENLYLLKKYAFSFLKDTRVEWKYDEDTGNVLTDFYFDMEAKEGTESNTLMVLFPHHYHYLNDNMQFTASKYTSVRGWLKTAEGNSFTTRIKNQGILASFPNILEKSDSYDADLLRKYIDTLNMINPDQVFPKGMDTYNDGKKLTKFAQAIETAKNAGQKKDFIETWLPRIKNRVEDWLSVTDYEATAHSLSGDNDTLAPGDYYLFYYNPLWQSIYGYPASFNTDTEFNDHHFHWGYFIRGVVDVMLNGELDFGSDENWGAMTKMLIRDIAGDYRKVADGGISDDGDPLFPKYRNWDPYMGYALASGHAGFSDGNNQESSSEGQNFNTAVALFGALTGDKYYRDLGIYMYATQTVTIEEYWFDVNNRNFWREERPWQKVDGDYVNPMDSATYRYPFVGMNWDNKSEMITWFSPVIELIAGINFLPFNAHSVYLGRNLNWMDDAYNTIVKLSQTDPDGKKSSWQNIIWQFLALANPQMAINMFERWPDFVNDAQINAEDHVSPGFNNYGENGTSKVYTYYWLNTMNASGHVDTNVTTASTPFYQVFYNNETEERTYVGYNPTSQELTADFNDGENLVIPPFETVSKSIKIIPPIINKNADDFMDNESVVMLIFDSVKVGDSRELLFTWCNKEEDVVVIDSVFEIISDEGFYVAYLDKKRTILPGYCLVGAIGFAPHESGFQMEELFFKTDKDSEDGFLVLASGVGVGGTSVENNTHVKIANNINLFPNPSKDLSYLQIKSESTLPRNVNVSLVNSEGVQIAKIFNGILSGSDNMIDLNLSGMPSGLYILNVIIDNIQYNKKLIIVK